MDETYGAGYEDLYRRHWWWRARETAILAELERIRPAPGWKRLLDIGCGNGLLFDHLAKFGDVSGVEPEAALLDPKGKWRQSIAAVPFDEQYRPGHQFDVILLLDVLEHLDQPALALRHALTLLAPGGVMLITVPAFQWLWTRHDDLNHHRRRYNRRTFRELAWRAGLRITRERFLFQWLVPAKLLVRALELFRSGPPAPPRVPPKPINGLLRIISVVQERITRIIPIPWGSSLMITGQRAAESAAEP